MLYWRSNPARTESDFYCLCFFPFECSSQDLTFAGVWGKQAGERSHECLERNTNQCFLFCSYRLGLISFLEKEKALLCLLLLFENSHKSCPESNLGLRRSGKRLQCLLLGIFSSFCPLRPQCPLHPPSQCCAVRSPTPFPACWEPARLPVAMERQLKLLIKKPLLRLSESRYCTAVFSQYSHNPPCSPLSRPLSPSPHGRGGMGTLLDFIVPNVRAICPKVSLLSFIANYNNCQMNAKSGLPLLAELKFAFIFSPWGQIRHD